MASDCNLPGDGLHPNEMKLPKVTISTPKCRPSHSEGFKFSCPCLCQRSLGRKNVIHANGGLSHQQDFPFRKSHTATNESSTKSFCATAFKSLPSGRFDPIIHPISRRRLISSCALSESHSTDWTGIELECSLVWGVMGYNGDTWGSQQWIVPKGSTALVLEKTSFDRCDRLEEREVHEQRGGGSPSRGVTEHRSTKIGCFKTCFLRDAWTCGPSNHEHWGMLEPSGLCGQKWQRYQHLPTANCHVNSFESFSTKTRAAAGWSVPSAPGLPDRSSQVQRV